jgi:hypothetical protein
LKEYQYQVRIGHDTSSFFEYRRLQRFDNFLDKTIIFYFLKKRQNYFS